MPLEEVDLFSLTSQVLVPLLLFQPLLPCPLSSARDDLSKFRFLLLVTAYSLASHACLLKMRLTLILPQLLLLQSLA